MVHPVRKEWYDPLALRRSSHHFSNHLSEGLSFLYGVNHSYPFQVLE
jgi:hypothetical protein